MAKCFFDTNIFLYLFSSDFEKADKAEELLAAGGTTNVQVLNEFVSVASRKMRMRYDEIRESTSVLMSACAVESMDVETHRLAINIAERYAFAFYDALVVAAALRAGCDTLYTEDLQHGQSIDRLRICNPFSP